LHYRSLPDVKSLSTISLNPSMTNLSILLNPNLRHRIVKYTPSFSALCASVRFVYSSTKVTCEPLSATTKQRGKEIVLPSPAVTNTKVIGVSTTTFLPYPDHCRISHASSIQSRKHLAIA
jgi:hypothetical protein